MKDGLCQTTQLPYLPGFPLSCRRRAAAANLTASKLLLIILLKPNSMIARIRFIVSKCTGLKYFTRYAFRERFASRLAFYHPMKMRAFKTNRNKFPLPPPAWVAVRFNKSIFHPTSSIVIVPSSTFTIRNSESLGNKISYSFGLNLRISRPLLLLITY